MSKLPASTPTPDLLLRTVLLAGKLLMQSGSDTARAETTMGYLLSAPSTRPLVSDYDLYVLLNSVFVRIDTDRTGFVQVKNRSNNLDCIDCVNQISRDYASGKIDLEETHQQLCAVQAKKLKPFAISKLLSAALLSATVFMLYGGAWQGFFAPMVGGLVAYCLYSLLGGALKISFANEYFSTLVGGFVGWLLCSWLGTEWRLVTIGTVIPLVPGIGLANSMRDLMAKHYTAGMIRFMECMCIAAALGGGIATVSYLFVR